MSEQTMRLFRVRTMGDCSAADHVAATSDEQVKVIAERLRAERGHEKFHIFPEGGVIVCADDAIERVALLEGLLREARNQIEYLHEKWAATGSGNTVLARIDAALGSRK